MTGAAAISLQGSSVRAHSRVPRGIKPPLPRPLAASLPVAISTTKPGHLQSLRAAGADPVVALLSHQNALMNDGDCPLT